MSIVRNESAYIVVSVCVKPRSDISMMLIDLMSCVPDRAVMIIPDALILCVLAIYNHAIHGVGEVSEPYTADTKIHRAGLPERFTKVKLRQLCLITTTTLTHASPGFFTRLY